MQVRRFSGPEAYVGVLDGIRVAHLTDLHVGRITPIAVHHEAVRRTHETHPDLVVITGDFVCHSQKYLDALQEVVASLKVPVFAVLGNHDYWSGADEVRHALRRAGVELLDNAHTVITVRHQRLQVLGLDDAYTGHADRRKALHGLRKDLPTLGLSHIGEEADALWAAGVPLVLSGHTHGGQVTLARLHELAIGKLAGHKYVHGLYGDRATHGAVYVGAGIGAAVIPLRLGERGKREVAVFELGAPAGAFDEHHREQTPLKGRAPTASLMARRKAVVEKKKARRHARKNSTR
ncbi:MAG: metallophosphoesterase [Deltaproteobacteria bacterium]|nr:metallophosphoesterase [Deltaproteobacteria bacterium]